MNAIAILLSAETTTSPSRMGEASSHGQSLFGALVVALAKSEQPNNEGATDAPADEAAPQVDPTPDMPPPFIARQWLAVNDVSSSLPKGTLLGLERHQLAEGVPVPPPDSEPNAETFVPANHDTARFAELAIELNGTAAHAEKGSHDDSQPDRSVLVERTPARLTDAFNMRLNVARDAAALEGSAPDSKSVRAVVQLYTSEFGIHGMAQNVLRERSASPALPSTRALATNQGASELRGDRDAASTGSTTEASDKPGAQALATVQRQDGPDAAHRIVTPRTPEAPPQSFSHAQPNPPLSEASSVNVTLSPAPSTVTDNAPVAPVKLAAITRHGEAAEMQSLALHIAARSARGESRFTIRLDPPELGQIEVNLSVSQQGHAQVVLAVEKPQTLELLSRDAPALERALKDAGLEMGGNLSFSLKEEGRSHFDENDRQLLPQRSPAQSVNPAVLQQLYDLPIGRLDIRV